LSKGNGTPPSEMVRGAAGSKVFQPLPRRTVPNRHAHHLLALTRAPTRPLSEAPAARADSESSKPACRGDWPEPRGRGAAPRQHL